MVAPSPSLLTPEGLQARAVVLAKTSRFASACAVYRRRVLAAYAADPSAHAACSDLGRFALISMTVRMTIDGQALPSRIAAIMAAAGFASARRTTVLIARLRDQGLLVDVGGRDQRARPLAPTPRLEAYLARWLAAYLAPLDALEPERAPREPLAARPRAAAIWMGASADLYLNHGYAQTHSAPEVGVLMEHTIGYSTLLTWASRNDPSPPAASERAIAARFGASASQVRAIRRLAQSRGWADPQLAFTPVFLQTLDTWFALELAMAEAVAAAICSQTEIG
jgi:hypothetical protein